MLKKILLTVIFVAIIIVGAVTTLRLTRMDDSSSSDKLPVTATFYPLYDFARQVGGDRVNVVNMTPAGAEPHDYEPSAKDLAKAYHSLLFIYNGENLEPWVNGFLSDFDHVSVKASQGIDLAGVDGASGVHSAMKDPHFWLDPVLAKQIVLNIRDGLSQIDSNHASYYAQNSERYISELARLDSDFKTGLSDCKLDTAISSHGAFSYLGSRYGFKVISIAGIDPDEEPSAARMAEISDIVKKKQIKYIFYEELTSPKLSETIAREAGVQTLVFDPIEGLSQSDQSKGRDYLSVQADNLKNLRQALECGQ